MQYSPKLKKAMAEIKEVLDKYDIAGLIVLHTPGHAEFTFRIDPSYSIAKHKNVAGKTGIHVKTDPNDSKELKHQKLTDTVNMFQNISDVAGRIALESIDLLETLEKTAGIEITKLPGNLTSNEEQNN